MLLRKQLKFPNTETSIVFGEIESLDSEVIDSEKNKVKVEFPAKGNRVNNVERLKRVIEREKIEVIGDIDEIEKDDQISFIYSIKDKRIYS